MADWKSKLDFYSSYLANWLSGGDLVDRGKLSTLGIKALYDKIVTRKVIKKVICVYKIPVRYNDSLTESLEYLVHSINNQCKVFTNIYAVPTKLNVLDDKFRANMARAEETMTAYQSVLNEGTATEQSLGRKIYMGGTRYLKVTKKMVKEAEDNLDSYTYINSVYEKGGQFSNSFVFIELMAPDTSIMKLIIKEVRDYLDRREFIYRELSANSSNFLSNYAPASYIKEFSNKEFMDVLLSDENIISLCPYKTQGFIGDGSGTLMGMDIRSTTPLILNFFGTGDRQVNVIYGPSGYGKSVLCFPVALALIDQNCHCSAIDVKGDEWPKLRKFVKTNVIDISETSNSYVNVYRLDDVEIEDSDTAKEFYDMAVTAGENIIRATVLGASNIDKENIIMDIARTVSMKMLSNAGVQPRYPRTFEGTKNIKYDQMIPILDSIAQTEAYAHHKTLIEDMKNSLTNKFVLSNTFKGKEISIRDIIDTPLNVYTLNKNSDQSLSSDESIRTFMISYLDMKKISVRKRQKLGTACFYEEMQRQEELAPLIRFISTVVTGARSSNVIVFLLTNDLNIFKEKQMKSIAGNISTAFIGAIEDESSYDVLSNIGSSKIAGKVKKISDNPTKYKHCFAVKYNTGSEVGTTVMKAMISPKYLDHFKTRDVIS